MTDFDDFCHQRNQKTKFNLDLRELTTGLQTISKNDPNSENPFFSREW